MKIIGNLLLTNALLIIPGFSLSNTELVASQPPQEAASAEVVEPVLTVGDLAPPLIVTQWLKGEPLPPFAPGKVYILDFWGSGCEPCLVSMPHLDMITREYQEKGLKVAAVAITDNANTAAGARKFVEEQGAKFVFPFALSEDESTIKDYVKVTNQKGIPCAFVIGQDGRIAYIGVPTDLDEVVPKVFDGTWRGKADAERVSKVRGRIHETFHLAENEPARSLAQFDKIVKEFPSKAKNCDLINGRIIALLKLKRNDEAKALTDVLAPLFIESKRPDLVAALGATWLSRDGNPSQLHAEMGYGLIEAALKIDDQEFFTLLFSAQGYHEGGGGEKAMELAEKALRLHPDHRYGPLLRERLVIYKASIDKGSQ